MTTFLSKLNLPLGDDFSNLKDFFSHAYVYAAQRVYQDDPSVSNGSNSIDSMSQGISANSLTENIFPQNIKAAGALYYIYELGDHLRIFRMTNMLLLMWAQGRLDLPQNSEAASLLYEYYKLREDRLSYEERGMIYRQALNLGNASLLGKMVPNEDFTVLWQQLLTETTDYIQKVEAHQDFDNLVSPAGIFEATRNLQRNLSDHMVGRLLQDTQEMYAQLQQCIRILSHEDVVERVAGGRLNNMWGGIENLSEQEFGITPNTDALRTLAVEGHKIFQWIAAFKGYSDQSQFDAESLEFRDFLNAVEAYIIANEQLDGGA